MVMRIETTILVEPVAKARARVGVSKSGRRYAYTPQKTAHSEALIRESVMKLGQRFSIGTPVRLVATFYLQRPKTLPKKVKLPVKRPDWDNLGKLLTDSLEKFVYQNDSQITDARIIKRFGTPPRIELVLEDDRGPCQ